MKIELDVHTHTIASGHAFSTLQEMAQAAADTISSLRFKLVTISLNY